MFSSQVPHSHFMKRIVYASLCYKSWKHGANGGASYRGGAKVWAFVLLFLARGQRLPNVKQVMCGTVETGLPKADPGCKNFPSFFLFLLWLRPYCTQYQEIESNYVSKVYQQHPFRLVTTNSSLFMLEYNTVPSSEPTWINYGYGPAQHISIVCGAISCVLQAMDSTPTTLSPVSRMGQMRQRMAANDMLVQQMGQLARGPAETAEKTTNVNCLGTTVANLPKRPDIVFKYLYPKSCMMGGCNLHLNIPWMPIYMGNMHMSTKQYHIRYCCAFTLRAIDGLLIRNGWKQLRDGLHKSTLKLKMPTNSRLWGRVPPAQNT